MDLETPEGKSLLLISTSGFKLQALVLLECCREQQRAECLISVERSCVVCLAELYRDGQLLEDPDQLQLPIDDLAKQLRELVCSSLIVQDLPYDPDAVVSELKQHVLRSEPHLLNLVWSHLPFENPAVSICAPSHGSRLSVEDAFFATSRAINLTPGTVRCLLSDASKFVHPLGDIFTLSLPSVESYFSNNFSFHLSRRNLELCELLPQIVRIGDYEVNLNDLDSICFVIQQSDPYIDLSPAVDVNTTTLTCKQTTRLQLTAEKIKNDEVADRYVALFGYICFAEEISD